MPIHAPTFGVSSNCMYRLILSHDAWGRSLFITNTPCDTTKSTEVWTTRFSCKINVGVRWSVTISGENGIPMIYDIIGDIHGHADKLEGLLIKLDYEMKDGFYQHNNRKVVFVGDFIDRGTQNRRVVEVVRGMVENGHAYATMGNHEYNAICYHTPKSETDYLRPHTKSKFCQHENTLKEYPIGHDDTTDLIAWFKSLPLYILMCRPFCMAKIANRYVNLVRGYHMLIISC